MSCPRCGHKVVFCGYVICAFCKQTWSEHEWAGVMRDSELGLVDVYREPR